MAKPKGFSTMCWLGIILSGLGGTFSFLVVLWQYYLHDKFKLVPSLVELEILNSEAEFILYCLWFFVYLAQLGYLAEMLKNRTNKIRPMLRMFAADFALTLISCTFTPNDFSLNLFSIIFAIIFIAIPIAFFCRQPVYDYLEK